MVGENPAFRNAAVPVEWLVAQRAEMPPPRLPKSTTTHTPLQDAACGSTGAAATAGADGEAAPAASIAASATVARSRLT